MSTLVAVQKSFLAQGPHDSGVVQRVTVLALLAILVVMMPGLGEAAMAVVKDAYLEIAVFVAATLGLIYGAEVLFKTNIGDALTRHQRWQVPAGAALGLFPGCGGAIVAVTQFTRGHMSFGGLVATLITTSGDAMFLLIVAEPMSALIVMAVAASFAVPFGFALDAIHGEGFLRPSVQRATRSATCHAVKHERSRKLDVAWVALMVPVAVIAIPATIADIDLVELIGMPIVVLALAGAALGLVMWAIDGEPDGDSHSSSTMQQIVSGTNFVRAWVVFAMIGYEAVVLMFDLNVESMLARAAVMIPIVAIAIGFIPGCGPQIIVTSMYLSGLVPFSAQIGNAISNDGDALFPAIAVAPKAAIVATIYSAIPAVVAAYGWFILFE